MTENVIGMRVEGMAAEKHSRILGQRIVPYGLIVVILAGLLIVGVAMHNRQTFHSAAPTIPRIVTSAETRFIESNTTNLPNGVAAEIPPVVTSAARNYLDVNTTWLPNDAAGMAPAIISSSQQRFVEVNTVMLSSGPSYPYAEAMTPRLGQRR